MILLFGSEVQFCYLIDQFSHLICHLTGVHFETGTISQTPYVMAEDVDKSSLPRGYMVFVKLNFKN